MQVGFANGERVLGEEAFSLTGRFPETIIARASDLLGKSADDPTIAGAHLSQLFIEGSTQNGLIPCVELWVEWIATLPQC